LTNNVVTASLTAVPGANNIEIVAINECGNSSDRLAITYTQPVVVPPCIAPTATIASPASNTSLTQAGFALTATVTNTTSNQVVVKLNGATVPFILTGNTITVQMTAISGTNTIEVMATNDCGNQTDNVVVNYNPCVSPTASISSPANNTALSGSSFTISANVTNVIRNQIAVKLNNIDVPFTLANNTITSQVTAVSGSNSIVVTVTNECGISTASASVTYLPPPAVTISSPSNSPVTTEDCKASFTASVENISDKQNISVSQNGSLVAFNFSGNTVTISNVNFTGTADFVIKATNGSGSDEKSVSFICKPKEKEIAICHYPPGNRNNPQAITIPESAWAAHEAHGDVQGACPVIPAPVVSITSPNNSPVTTEDCKASITASVENISDKQNISVSQNGSPVAFIFSGNTVTVSNTDFTGTANFIIKATNASGSDEKSVSFICKPKEKEIAICHYPPGNRNNPQAITIPESAWAAHEAHGDVQGACPVIPEPELTITSPENSSVTVDDCKVHVQASVKHVTEKKDIHVTLNGKALSFEFNEGIIQVSDVAFTDQATIVIQASNKAGAVTQSVEFKREAKAEKPETNEEKKPETEEEKITICHHPPGNRENPQTITISASAWPAHEKHGDTLGPCKDN
jgi:hypothetical protein